MTCCTLCRLLAHPPDAALISALGPDDWHLLATTARREGVAPLLYHALNAAGWLANVPTDVQADLRQAYYATTALNLLAYRELDRVLAALTAVDPNTQSPISPSGRRTGTIQYPISNPSSPIPTVILKGAALATALYPAIGLRPLGDLDLLVPEDRLPEAVARLKARGYVEPHPDMAPGLNAIAGHHVHLQGGQDVSLAVELHWTLIGGEHDWRSPSLPWFWSQTEPFPNPQSLISDLQPPTCHPAIQPSAIPLQGLRSHQPSAICTFTPTAHLLYLCAHLMLQHGQARSVLRWFYDIYLLVEREGQRVQWDELVARAREFRWAPAVHAALMGARERFAGSPGEAGDAWLPAGVLEALAEASDVQASRLVARRADSLQTRATGVVAAVSTLSPRARLRLLLAIAIPSPAYVRWRYKPNPPWLWPLYYPYRWLDILREGLSTLWRVARR